MEIFARTRDGLEDPNCASHCGVLCHSLSSVASNTYKAPISRTRQTRQFKHGRKNTAISRLDAHTVMREMEKSLCATYVHLLETRSVLAATQEAVQNCLDLTNCHHSSGPRVRLFYEEKSQTRLRHPQKYAAAEAESIQNSSFGEEIPVQLGMSSVPRGTESICAGNFFWAAFRGFE
ncbi:hypothetical protein TSAR_005802 [Trichomalopsis sarcophagae]|uniref:Uncharacterized protein n=1 Tax=Trichomalopsis sarcophagae TaxID=543379 RepID=A0A232ENJ2_9HYME|nr:hypothetical protein TSAR_005802 [Trichomalopsis sarcophagae]